jgi:acetyl esterase/lipase
MNRRITFTAVGLAMLLLLVAWNAAAQDPRSATPQQPTPTDGQRAVPEEVVYQPDVVYATVPVEGDESFELLMDVAFPKKSGDQRLPAVVYLHPGGFRSGSRSSGRAFIIAMAQGGYVAATVDYRLAGQAHYPAAVHDCKAAIRFLRANADELGIDPDRIGVWGTSAGGHLAALVATSADVAELEGSVGTTGVSSAVACAATVSGSSDFTAEHLRRQGHAILEEWFGQPLKDIPDQLKQASPVTHVDLDDPAMLIIHGENDQTVPVTQARTLHEKLIAAQVPSTLHIVVDGGHGLGGPEVFRRVKRFFDLHLQGQASMSPAG